MARIDILLPVRDGMPYLREAIDSIRAQSERDWRLLVLEHGSTDGSRQLVERYAAADRRIELHDGRAAANLAELLNLGLARCDGRYVMRHDADDICLPERMALTLAAFAQHPGMAVVGGQADIIDAAGAVVGQLRLPVGSARLCAASLFRNPISHPALTMDRAAIDGLGAQYGRDFLGLLPAAQRPSVGSLAEDYLMFGQLAILGKCINIPQRLIRYRWHGGNVSVTRRHDQLRLALPISRYLAHAFCALHGLPPFDPAPFCNHGGRLYALDGRSDYDGQFHALALALRYALGPSAELERELGFRRTLAHRHSARMLLRYLRFARRHGAETGEWYAVKSWLLRHLPGHALTAAS